MSLWHLILREIRHRRLNFALALLAVTVAVGSVVGAETLLRMDRAVTQVILESRQAEVEAAVAGREEEVARTGAALEDAMRKTMRELGFNVLILPEEQDLAELHLNGTLSETMPESYVDKLSKSSIVSINHLLPSVTRRIRWDEREIEVILQGTRGEVPILHSKDKKPLLDAVAPGKMVVGYEIHKQLGLAVGDQVTFQGREFTISTLHPERGSSDDVTVWIDLKQAQDLLGMQNLIHGILALECECAGDRITQIRKDIAGLLPGTKVIERYSSALTRAEARGKAKETAETALAQEKAAGAAALAQERESRERLERQHAGFAAILVPLLILAAAVWVGLLAFGNARQRTGEIGILRAIGVRARSIMLAFLSKSLLIGFLGGVFGSLVGLALGITASRSPHAPEFSVSMLQSGTVPLLIGLSLLLAPLLSAAASLLPAMLAARQDPAAILQGE